MGFFFIKWSPLRPRDRILHLLNRLSDAKHTPALADPHFFRMACRVRCADITEARNIPINELNLAVIGTNSKLPEHFKITWISESKFNMGS